MSKTPDTQTAKPSGDLVLKEIWRIKDELSAARGHDVHRLFAEARERQKHSGHPTARMADASTATALLRVAAKPQRPDMKKKLAARDWFDDLLEYERTHEIAFASSSALRGARLIAELERVKQNRPRHLRKTVVG